MAGLDSLPADSSPPIDRIPPLLATPDFRARMAQVIEGAAKEWKRSFDIVRELRFRFEDVALAIDWLEQNGFADHTEGLESLWDSVRCPPDALAYAAQKSGPGWKHPKLNLLDRPSRLRHLAGMAFYCQQFRPGSKPFLFIQAKLAGVLDCDPSCIQRDIRYLVRLGWLTETRRFGHKAKTMVLYSCPAANP